MVNKRKRFQGVSNIILFNWHKYVIALIFCTTLTIIAAFLAPEHQSMIFWVVGLAIIGMLVSLFISFYVYDLSNLYEFHPLGNLNQKKVLNINAGFDEVSQILTEKFPMIDLKICDFYDPIEHTEVSIKRAREKYPAMPGTILAKTNNIPFPDQTFDKVICIFSAHEIRNMNQRIEFLNELKRVIRVSGEVIITEHLRDIPNFLAYNIGFLHFYSKNSRFNCFQKAGLFLEAEVKVNPFISTFILRSNGK